MSTIIPVVLITESATKRLMGREHVLHGDDGQKNDSCLGQDGAGFHHVIQNSTQFKTYKLFTSGIFHLILWTVVRGQEMICFCIWFDGWSYRTC